MSSKLEFRVFNENSDVVAGPCINLREAVLAAARHNGYGASFERMDSFGHIHPSFPMRLFSSKGVIGSNPYFPCAAEALVPESNKSIDESAQDEVALEVYLMGVLHSHCQLTIVATNATEAGAVRLPVLGNLVSVTVNEGLPGARHSFLATLGKRACGSKYRALVMNDVIMDQAKIMLEVAHLQADAAIAADATHFAAGQAQYAGVAGQLAAHEVALADSRVTRLQSLAAGRSDFGPDGFVDVQDWRELLKHFGRSLSIGAI